MIKSNKISICIPTYNRSDLLISQLNFWEKEISYFKDSVEIIVADNFSDKIHREKIIKYKSDKDFFHLKLNEKNLGAIGNIYYLLGLVDSDYVWFVSDDDLLLGGILKHLTEIIKNNKPLSYIFLKYNTFKNDPSKITHSVNLLGYKNYIQKGKQCLVDLFLENGEINMFITSCVYTTSQLKEFRKKRQKETLMDPLLFSLKLSSMGPIYIENEVFVLQRWDNPSWSNEGVAIFSWQVQEGLIEMINHSYEKKDIKKMIGSSYLTNRGNYLRMLLKAPLKTKIKIMSILGLLQFKIICMSIFYNLKRLIQKLTNKN